METDMDPFYGEPTFLGYGAFETTAFITAILVAMYSLIKNPTGRQRATDQAEYQVYAGWRLALLTIVFQFIFMLVIVLKLLIEQSAVAGNAKLWLFLLMITPWAPLAGSIRDTLSSFFRVRRMMRNRLTRNELTCTIRDRFKFGQRAIAVPIILEQMLFLVAKEQRDDIGPALSTFRNCTFLSPHEEEVKKQANMASRIEGVDSLKLGVLWATNQGPQISSFSKFHLRLWALIPTFDLLARAWTLHTIRPRTDCMPRIPATLDRARLLDVIDSLQQGGTMSDDVSERLLANKFCHRCRLATRATVESFLESCELGHTDFRPHVWLRDKKMDWRGSFERIIDGMWEAVFLENTGLKVDAEEDFSPAYGNRSKTLTVKSLGLIFLICRSLMFRQEDKQECEYYESVAGIVNQGCETVVWWERYWNKLCDNTKKTFKLNEDEEELPMDRVNEQIRAQFKAALRDIIDEDMMNIVNHFVRRPVVSICCDEKCDLRNARLLIVHCATKQQ